MRDCDLHDMGVLVTRPLEQAESLARDIRHRGGVPTIFPGVAIEPVIAGGLKRLPERLTNIDLVIFVSPTSVRIGLSALAEHYGPFQKLRVAAVGQSTAAELKKHGITEIIVPGNSSGAQALAECPQLSQVSGWAILIVRGEGGNDTLESVLQGRGAAVTLFECYRRRLPDTTFSSVAPLIRDGRIAAWMATSSEILDNLFRLAGEQGELLCKTPLFVNHPRVAASAFSRSVKVIFVTAGGDNGLVGGLLTWFCRLRNSTPATE